MPKLIDKNGNELLNLQMSTDEHWTGKYWIDGKKIYEKIITWTGLRVGVSTIDHSISNLGEFKMCIRDSRYSKSMGWSCCFKFIFWKRGYI